jgi:hypothetical protein
MKLKKIGANQTELTLVDGTQIFFSYETAVCVIIEAMHLGKKQTRTCVTDKKYSQTTSGHINNWVANQSSIIQMVPQSEINNFVNGASI